MDNFYFAKTEGRYNNPCKECARIRSAERLSRISATSEYREKQKVRAKKYYHTIVVPNKPIRINQTVRERKLKYRQKFPEKYIAHIKMKNIKATEGYHFHHWSYNKEHHKDVIEILAADHRLLHKYTVYDSERLMYRTVDGVLLDTKQSAIDYLSFLKTPKSI